nr:hypothetical protein CFP56_07401 [Quercus suber]
MATSKSRSTIVLHIPVQHECSLSVWIHRLTCFPQPSLNMPRRISTNVLLLFPTEMSKERYAGAAHAVLTLETCVSKSRVRIRLELGGPKSADHVSVMQCGFCHTRKMKFRTSFTISGSKSEQRRQRVAVVPPGEDKESVSPKEYEYAGEGCLPLRLNRLPTFNIVEEQFNYGERPAARKHSVSSFFRGLRSKDALDSSHSVDRHSVRPRTSDQANRPKRPASRQKNKTRLSFEASDDAIERLMGPPKDSRFPGGHSDAQLPERREKLAVPTEDVSLMQQTSPTSAESPMQQARSPVCRQELDAMFRGAPYFSNDETTLTTKVSYVENGEVLVVESNLDHRDFESTTFAASTMALDGMRTLEIPSMLSANGLDAGTVGFEHFLQLPVADALKERDSDENLRAEKRKLLDTQPETLGLRTLDMRAVTERLAALDALYANMRKRTSSSLESQTGSDIPWSEHKIEELGEQLFTELIDAELGISAAGTGSVTMSTQIEALLKVLSEENLWFDFSRTETRLRLGQILFEEDHSSSPPTQLSERDLLFLQITVAAELLIRLQAVKVYDLQEFISNAELERLEAQMCTAMAWNLLLAERFLDNMSVAFPKQESLTSPFNGIPLSFKAPGVANDARLHLDRPLLNAKYIDQQKAGLLDFAAAIRWPHLDDVRTHITHIDRIVEPPATGGGLMPPKLSTRRPISGMTIYHTPPSTPGCSPGLPLLSPTLSNRSDHSYFSVATSVPDRKQHEAVTPSLSINMNQATTANSPRIKVDPWISQQWLFGLILPGGSASALLMGSLLETSPPSLWTLGPLASLHSGFVYKKQAFWSKESVVGRVLAAAHNVAESMNWISIPTELLSDIDEGWANIDPRAVSKRDHEPRLKRKGAVSRASDPLYGQHETAVQTVHFTTPTDSPPIMGNEARLEGLSIKKAAYGPATAQLTFSSLSTVNPVSVVVPLTHDVHFIASYPCQPPPPLPSPNTLTRNLTGSSHIGELVSLSIDSHPSPTSQPDISARAQTPISRPSASRSPPARPLSTTVRTARSISGMALTSRPNTFYETATDQEPSNSVKSWQPSPPSPNHKLTIDESITPYRTTSKPSNPLTLDLAQPVPAAHPLHVGFTYTVLPAATILTSPPEALDPRALSVDLSGAGYMLASRQASIVDDVEQEIIVLDCRGSVDLEVLARAWCSKIGEHAVIGKVGRTCLACCVREARGLGVGVVIRV